jgi:regulator of ribosome biosynthesis
MLQSHATASLRQLFSQLTSLDRESESIVKLPPPTIHLPREKPIPIEKPPTRFEQFVKNKGLKIKKKETKVFDEATGEWRLAYGYKRGGKPQDDWLIEVPGGVDDDPFAKREADKKESLAEQKKRERRNKQRAARAVADVASVSTKGNYRTDTLKAAVHRASNPGSSASMNQFNKVPNKLPIFEGGSEVPKLFDRTKGQKKK